MTRSRAALVPPVSALAAVLLFAGCAASTPMTAPVRVPSVAAPAPPVAAAPTPTTATSAQTITETAAAAQTFAMSLSERQRAQLVRAYDDATRTTTWSNLPIAFSERTGLDLTDLADEQYSAALNVLQALLSEEGYATVAEIMAGDAYLRQHGSDVDPTLGRYYLAFFGEPSATAPWALQVGGHHLGVNATLDGRSGFITLAPTHLGAQPLVYPGPDGADVAPLLPMYESAFAFFESLTDGQQSSLHRGSTVEQLACEPARACAFPSGEGLPGSDLTPQQRALLLAVIARWVGLADSATARATLERITASLERTWVTWSGATAFDMTAGEGISLRISGPDVYIELASQAGSRGADVAGLSTAGWGHLHTVYRDPRRDYGGGVSQR